MGHVHQGKNRVKPQRASPLLICMAHTYYICLRSKVRWMAFERFIGSFSLTNGTMKNNATLHPSFPKIKLQTNHNISPLFRQIQYPVSTQVI